MFKEVLSSRYEMIIGLLVPPSQVFFHVRKQKLSDGAKSEKYVE